MGQQQLLLLVLATVIVGLATVAGIQAFEQGSVRSTQDALTQSAVKIASDIQARTSEPSQFGGYDGDMTKSGAKNSITIDEMGYETGSGNSIYDTASGECVIVSGGGNTPGLSAGDGKTNVSTSGKISVLCESEDVEVVANISGLDSEDISTQSGIDQNSDVSGSGS